MFEIDRIGSSSLQLDFIRDPVDPADPVILSIRSSPLESIHDLRRIGRSRHQHMMAEHQHLAEQGAKLVELRLDYVAGKVNIRRLLAERPDAR